MKNKVVIIGTGNVGLSYAYALINQPSYVNELVLIDINHQKARGEAMDLNHGMPFGPNHIIIKSGDYEECRRADIVCICAGANQEVGETRLDLIKKNKLVFTQVVEQVMAHGFNGIFLVATNPVDIMTFYIWKLSNLPHQKVIGSGTTLDTARLRYELGRATGINSKNIHAYVIGEHGDSEFVPWSSAIAGAQPITDFLAHDQLNTIEEKVRTAAYHIIKDKGNTSYGIGMCLVKITNAILNDQDLILSVSCYDKINDVYVGMPAIINRDGIKQKIKLTLTEEEETKLSASINTLKRAINS